MNNKNILPYVWFNNFLIHQTTEDFTIEATFSGTWT